MKNIILSAKKEYFNLKFILFDNEFFEAVLSNNQNQVVAFLEQGVDIDFQDKEKNTALHHAAEKNMLEMVMLLLEHEANPNIKNINNDTPLLLICKTFQHPPEGQHYNEDWHYKVNQKASPIIIALIKAGADIEATNKQYELPLGMAVKSGYNQGAKFLILNGANPLARDNNNSCALGYALSFKKIEIVEYIYTHPKDKQQLKEFNALNSLYPATQNQFVPLLKSMDLKLSLENNLPERKNSPKLGKI